MGSITEGKYLNEVLKWEEENLYSREKVTVLAGQNLNMGAVLGCVSKDIPVTGTAGANTGNGTCAAVSGGEDTRLGTYTLRCVQAVANGGKFEVVSPDGDSLPDALVGTPYVNNQVNFTLNDGSTDFSVGDIFTILVTEGSQKVRAIDFNAKDGTQEAFGFLTIPVDASGGDKAGVAIVHDALIVPDNLVWPSGASATQKAKALAQLKAAGIVTREQV